jgi:hypothetical protein
MPLRRPVKKRNQVPVRKPVALNPEYARKERPVSRQMEYSWRDPSGRTITRTAAEMVRAAPRAFSAPKTKLPYNRTGEVLRVKSNFYVVYQTPAYTRGNDPRPRYGRAYFNPVTGKIHYKKPA